MINLCNTAKIELMRQFEFKKYVFSFYGKHKDGLYLQSLNLSQKQINYYCDIFIATFHICYPKEFLDYGSPSYDSIDRERVREIIELGENDNE